MNESTSKPLTSEERLTLRHLVQHVARTFFDVDQVVALDQLAKHDVLKDEDLAGRIGVNAKDTAKRLGKLVNSRLVMCHSQNEQRDANTTRSSIRKYYYIDYPIFVNLVKWGIAEMRRVIDNTVRNELADKGYICLQCKTKYTMFDADRLFDPFRNGFFCESCGGEVSDNSQDDDEPDGSAGKGQKMQRFNARTERIVALLKKTDEMILPKLDIIDWVTKYAEAQHAAALAAESSAHGAGASGDTNNYEGLKIAGMNGTGAPTGSKVSVEIIDMDEKEQARRRREKEEEADMKRQQNALPSWYTHSTITGDATAFGIKNDIVTRLTPPPSSLPSTSQQQPSQPAVPPSLSALSGLDALVTMDDEDDFGAQDSDDEDVKPSIVSIMQGEVKPSVADMTPEARAEYYAKYYASLSAPASQTPGAGGSGTSSPALGFLNSPLPGHNDSGSDSGLSASRGKKRAREDDEFADSADDEAGGGGGPAAGGDGAGKSGVIVHVNGVPMDFSDVTDDHHDQMTPEEYEVYFEVASRLG